MGSELGKEVLYEFPGFAAPESANRKFGKARQVNEAESGIFFEVGSADGKAGSKPVANVNGHEVLGRGFHRGAPGDAAGGEFPLEKAWQEFVRGQADQRHSAGGAVAQEIGGADGPSIGGEEKA